MLIVVKHWNLHPASQFALDLKTVRSLDVFQVDTAEGWLKCGDDFN